MKLKKNVIRFFYYAGLLLCAHSIVTFLFNLVLQGDDFNEIVSIAIMCLISGFHGFLTAKGSRHALKAIQKYENKSPANEWILWLISHTAGFITMICGFIEMIIEAIDEIFLLGLLIIFICIVFYPKLVRYKPGTDTEPRETVIYNPFTPEEQEQLDKAEQNLRELLEAEALTQEEFDELIGMTQTVPEQDESENP